MITENGFISPANIAFTVAYEEIIPILMTVSKDIIEENSKLKKHNYELESRVEDLEAHINDLQKQMEELKRIVMMNQ